MVLIYADRTTARLEYTVNLIFRDILGMDFSLTTSAEQFIASSSPKLSYCEKAVYDELHITSTPLLFTSALAMTEVECSTVNGVKALFPNYSQEDCMGFDVFAATFYLVTRYEEYMPSILDAHQRFPAVNSIAFQNGFLDKPIVNIWAEILKRRLMERYPAMSCTERKFRFVNTIDVDMMSSYLNKGFMRNLGGFLRDMKEGKFSLCAERLKVLMHMKQDPLDCFDWIVNTVKKHNLDTVFFFLFTLRSRYDKCISPFNTNMQLLVKNMRDYARIGIHPSYYSMEYPTETAVQTKRLASVLHDNVTLSRFHYLRFALPASFRVLFDCGITDEYSMGYADMAGFRAGICTPYNFFDLERNTEMRLRIHPFMCMDVTLKNAMNLSPEEAEKKIKSLMDEVKKVGGEFISIWHNESLSDAYEWKGWRKVYQKQLEYVL